MFESVENLEKENKLKSLLKGKKDSSKRKYTEESSNSRSSSKSQKRTPEYRQNFRGSQSSRPQKTSKNFQNDHHQSQKHSSYLEQLPNQMLNLDNILKVCDFDLLK